MEKNKSLWVDFIRVTAIFFVIVLHSSAPLLYEYNKLSAINWWAGNIYNSLVRMCVPLLFMLSGYLLLGKQETLKVYFTKRINKVLIPLIVWSIFYIFWKGYFYKSETTSFYSFYSIIISPAFYHLWFLYALIGIYLYIPVLRILVQNSPKKILYYFIALWFIAVAAIPIFERVTAISSNIDLRSISGYVGYLVIGYLLGNVQTTKRQFNQALLVALVCLIITMSGTFFLTVQNNGEYDNYFNGYLSPNVILLSVSAFILLKYIFSRIVISEKHKTILNILNSASFGIYLIHPMIMRHLRKGTFGLSWDVLKNNAIYSVPIMAILTFGIAFVITLLLRQIPYVRKCVP